MYMDHTNLREPPIANRAQGRKLTLTLYLTLVPVIVVAFGLLLYLNLNEFNTRIKELQDKHLKSDLEAITSLSRSPAFHHYFDYMQYEMGQEAAIALETIHTLLYEEIQISKKYRAQVMSITLASKYHHHQGKRTSSAGSQGSQRVFKSSSCYQNGHFKDDR